MQADSPGRLRSEAFLTLQKCRAEKCAGAGKSHCVPGLGGWLGLQAETPQLLFAAFVRSLLTYPPVWWILWLQASVLLLRCELPCHATNGTVFFLPWPFRQRGESITPFCESQEVVPTKKVPMAHVTSAALKSLACLDLIWQLRWKIPSDFYRLETSSALLYISLVRS